MILHISTTMTPLRWGRLCNCIYFFLSLIPYGIRVPSFTLFHQGEEDPLGSIHLRGSVVTAVDYVPDGKIWLIINHYLFISKTKQYYLNSRCVILIQGSHMAKHCKLLMVIRKVNFSFLALLQLRSMRSRATCLRSLLQMRYTTTCRQLQLKNAMTGSELFKLFQSLENNCIKHFNSKGSWWKKGLWITYYVPLCHTYTHTK